MKRVEKNYRLIAEYTIEVVRGEVGFIRGKVDKQFKYLRILMRERMFYASWSHDNINFSCPVRDTRLTLVG